MKPLSIRREAPTAAADTGRLLPNRADYSDEERRLREAINRLTDQMMKTLDSAIHLRSASNEAQRARHLARGHLVDFALKAMHAMALSIPDRTED